MNTYFALTIGPIYKTLSQAERTREFWGSSYMFSWIMREIILGMISKDLVSDDQILMPHRKKHDRNLKVGTGLYHDRMIAQIKSDKTAKVMDGFKTVTDEVLTAIADKKSPTLKNLQSYFRFNAIIIELQDSDNIIENISNYLDSLELQNPLFHEAWSIDWAKTIVSLNKPFLYEDAFSDYNSRFVFDSIPEIATRGLQRVNETEYQKLVQQFIKDKFDNNKTKKKELEDQDEFINQISSSDIFKNEFYNYHKYIAIVHADGDNLGETISKIGTSADQVKKLSKALFDFAKKSVEVISKYGGTNVYAGGDDLLFFAPVANGKQTIFSLINNLDELFKKEVCKNPELTSILGNPNPTLSWGVSISYYKFPLSEAIVNSRNLLFDDAKNYPDKNAVAFKLIKHTGQFFGATFGKGHKDYNEHFENLLNQSFASNADFLSSLQYRISSNEALLKEVFRDADYATKVKNFFNNFFDEEIHSNKKDFVEAVCNMLVQAFSDCNISEKEIIYKTKEEKEEKKREIHEKQVRAAIEKTYSALRFIHFLNSKSDE